MEMTKDGKAALDKLRALADKNVATVEDLAALRTQHEATVRTLDETKQKLAAIQEQVRARSISLPGSGDEDVVKRFRLGNLIHFLATKQRKVAEYEIDICRETYKRNEAEILKRMEAAGDSSLGMVSYSRTLTTLVDSGAGALIPAELAAKIWPNFYAKTLMKQAGSPVITPGGSPFSINVQTSSTSGQNIAEGAAPTATDIAFTTKVLNPHKISVFSKLTEEQIKWSTPSTDGLVKQDQERKLKIKQDTDLLIGSGSSSAVLGLINVSGTTTNPLASTPAPTRSALIDLEGALDGVDALEDGGKFSYITHPKVRTKLKKERIAQFSGQTDGSYVQMPMNNARLREDIGYDIFTTTSFGYSNSPTNTQTYLIFGNFLDAVITEWGGVELKMSDQANDGTDDAFTKDLVFLKTSMWHDFAVVRPASFVIVTDVTF